MYRALQGDLAALDKRLGIKKEPFSGFSSKPSMHERNPKFDHTGLSNTTATTMARTREIKKEEIYKTKFDQIPNTKTDSAPVKDEWDFNFFQKKEKKAKGGTFLDRFSKAMKKEKKSYGSGHKMVRGKKEKVEKLNQRMEKTMNRGKRIEAEEQVVGQRNIAKNMEMELEAEDAEFEKLFECQGCGRSFKRDALQRHTKACKKVFQTKRKEFETQDQRMIAKEQKLLAQKGERKMRMDKNLKKKKKGGWKKKSEGLRNMIKKNAKKNKGKKKEVEVEILLK